MRLTVDETILNFRNAAEHIKWMETSVIPVQGPNKRVITICQPRGVYAVLTPFNFPMAIPSEYLPYALAAGKTIAVGQPLRRLSARYSAFPFIGEVDVLKLIASGSVHLAHIGEYPTAPPVKFYSPAFVVL